MSNWYQHELEIKGSAEQVKAALKYIINEQGDVDFNIAAPIPEGCDDPNVIRSHWGVYSIAFYTRTLADNKFYFSTKNDIPITWLTSLGPVLVNADVHVTLNLTSAEGGAMVGQENELDVYGILSGRNLSQDEVRQFLNIEDEEIDETMQNLEKLVEDADHLYVLGAEVGYLHDILYEHYDESIRFAGKDSTDALVKNTIEPDGLTIEIEDHDWVIEITSLNESISDNIPMSGLSDEKLVRLAELLTDLYELMVEHDINPEEAHDYQ